MKNKDKILAIVQGYSSAITTNRNEWQMERITEPRPSCLQKWQIRNELRNLPPKGIAYINGIFVKRTGHRDPRYLIGDATMMFDQAVYELEMTVKVAKPKEPKQGELRQLSLFEEAS